jgi:lysophospholipase L1-like esterase
VASPPRPSRARRLLVAVLAPIVFLAAAEGALTILGIGSDPPFFTPDPNDPSRLARSPNYREFFATPPAPFLARKPANGFRVVVIGESTVAGYPYFYATLCDWLQAQLSDLLPGRAVEVINAGVVGWTSFRLTWVLEQCLPLQPDVVVWMVGHNEERSADNLLRLRWRREHPVRAALGDAVGSLRLARLLGRARRREVLQFPPEEGRDVPRVRAERDLVRAEYQQSLDLVAARARAAGARLVLTTMPLNARTLGPSGSAPDPNITAGPRAALLAHLADAKNALDANDPAAALAASDAALALDRSPADAHFHRARALEALGRCDEARAAFAEAMERDLWPSRARSWIQEAIRAEAKKAGAVLVDLKGAFDAHGKCGVAGPEWLCDDVHPNLDGHRAIADLLVQALADANIPIPKNEWAWGRRRGDEEIRRSFGTAEAAAFADSRANGYLRLFETFLLPPSEADARRAKSAEARASLERAHALIPGDTRVEVLLATAEIEAGAPGPGAARLRAALARDRGVAAEFARIVEVGDTLRARLAAAGVSLAEIQGIAKPK